jgi:hypothetical protein
MIEKNLIEFRPQNLVCRRTFGIPAVSKIKPDPFAARGDNFASVLDQKSARIDFWLHSHPLKRIEASRKHRLPDTETRKLFPVKDYNASPCLGEKRPRRTSGGTSPDDCYINRLRHAYENYLDEFSFGRIQKWVQFIN